MKYAKTILFYIIICCNTSIAAAQSISVDDNKTAQDLVNLLTTNNSCANTSAPNTKGDELTPGKKSFGSFKKEGSSFPFTEGIILSTWSSTNAIGPYIAGNNGGGNSSWLGDIDLDQALNIKSINATVLEFDFIPLTDFISFNYIFASNEYQGIYPCNFSDGFAFLIKENIPGATYQNLAVIPGTTTTTVSSKNVHPAISPTPNPTWPINGCPPANENYFQGYNTGASPINYAGQTKIMNAQTTVVAGRNYHIKLVIADAENRFFDSAIFLEAGSFLANIDLGPDRTTASSNPLCYGENFTIDTKLPATYAYEWYKDISTTPIPGETNPSLTIATPGTYKVKVILSPTTCTAEDEIKIEYIPQIVLNNTTLYQCDDNGDGISVFNLTKADNTIKNNDPNLIKLVYYKSLTDAQNETNPIQNPDSYTNSVPNETLTARVSNTFDCVNYAQLNLVISNNPISPQNPIESCDTDTSQDGITQFDLNVEVTPQVINGLPNGLTVEYYLNQTDAIEQKNQLPNLFTNTIPNQQTIYARIVNGPDCYKITPETLVVNVFNPADFQDETSFICENSTKILTVDSGFSSYLWSNGSTTNTTTVTAPGEYSVTVNNPGGCQKTKKYIVNPSGIGTITNVAVSDFAGTENSVTISYTGMGDYEFSLDENLYQDSPVFNGLSPGMYWATMKDKNGCGISVPYQVYVLDYPRFFTPNNDGFNDTWKIKNLDLLSKSSVTIFDRYGKLLKQLKESNTGWNGTFLGRELPSDDYWFVLTFEDGKIIKGHFSLKR